MKSSNPDYGVILQREIWFWIGKRLESRLDVSRFRSVCRTWRSILPPPFRFPLRVPRPPGLSPIHNDGSVSHFLTEISFYAANDRIVVFEEEYRGGEFSASALVHIPDKVIPDMKLELPPVSQIPNLSFLCNAYHVHDAFPRLVDGKRVANKCDFVRNYDVFKVTVISSDGSASANPNYSRLGDLRAVAHLFDRKLAVLSLDDALNSQWETGFCNIAFDDIVKYRGQLYGVETSGRAFVMDYISLQMTEVAPALSGYEFAKFPTHGKLMHLAVVSGDLYMFIHENERFKHEIVIPPALPRLYKLSFRLGKWIEADQDLPDQVFVQHPECNFAVPRDLLCRGLGCDLLPRFCSWPYFQFVRVAVGFKNAYGCFWSSRGRLCDQQNLPFRIHK